MEALVIRPLGRFDLRQSTAFGFGQREAAITSDLMRLAFVLDGYERQVGVAVRQRDDGSLLLDVAGEASPDQVRAQVARVLSVDVDATGYDELGERHPLVGAAQRARPGLRPPLFHSAYEAAAWAVLSARRPARQMAQLRDRLAAAFGAEPDVAGVRVPAFPTPRQLLGVAAFPALSADKVERLHGVARAALDGGLDTDALRRLPPEDALATLRELDGIGPFYAELILVRALGHTDVLPTREPRLLEVVGRLSSAGRPLTPHELADVAEGWRPWRTWVCVALRAAGPELVAA
jgi:DNA-3-methyladenine glycosylase II